MGTTTTTALRKLLTSLCENSHWNYAVLWRLRQGNGYPSSLTCEDWFVDHPKLRDFVGGVLDDLYNDNACNLGSYQLGKTTSNGSSGACPVGLLVADMSHLHYVLGEGIVGEVALTGRHLWVSFNDLFSSQLKPKLVPECTDEWLFHFASGIKTILLVPILPLGVLQLGSIEEITEDPELVASIRDKCNAFTMKGEVLTPVKSEDSNHPITITSIKVDKDHSSTQNLSVFPVQDGFQICEKGLPEIPQSENSKCIHLPRTGHWQGSFLKEAAGLEMMDNKLFELSCLMEEFQACTGGIDYMFGALEEPTNWMLDCCLIGDLSGKSVELKEINNSDLSNFTSYHPIPDDCDIHKALGRAFGGKIKARNQSRLVEDTCGGLDSEFICKKEVDNKTEPSWLARGADTACLLEAVVANGCSGSEDTGSTISNNLRFPTNLSKQLVAFASESQSEGSVFMGEDALQWRNGISECGTGGRFSNSSSATLTSTMSMIFKMEQHERVPDQTQPMKGRKMSTLSKRTAKPGENQRPRPRDRQLIQDRVRELRELVPNGAKCSIDGLLGQTIKHVIYLQSVADQAEKLKELMHQKIDHGKVCKPTETKSSAQSGTSCAFEFGSVQQVCPIVVEDLVYPGHMLIDMLCNEQCLFLEIAQVIRGLELTILKGIMESRSNTMWAHFIVEASKGFHRLDIFWPLMQLVQRKRGPISSYMEGI